MTSVSPDYTYTLVETIRQLESWDRGGRMFPIDVAVSAVHWLETAPIPEEERTVRAASATFAPPLSLNETVSLLGEWLGDETQDLPEDTAYAALYWLRHVARAGKP